MWLSKKIYREIDSEAFINDEVIERVEFVDSDVLLHEEVTELLEKRHISELDRIMQNLDKREMIAVLCVAVRKMPFVYMQVLAEWVLEEFVNKRKGVKKG